MLLPTEPSPQPLQLWASGYTLQCALCCGHLSGFQVILLTDSLSSWPGLQQSELYDRPTPLLHSPPRRSGSLEHTFSLSPFPFLVKRMMWTINSMKTHQVRPTWVELLTSDFTPKPTLWAQRVIKGSPRWVDGVTVGSAW